MEMIWLRNRQGYIKKKKKKAVAEFDGGEVGSCILWRALTTAHLSFEATLFSICLAEYMLQQNQLCGCFICSYIFLKK